MSSCTASTNFTDYDDVAARIRAVQGVKLALPLVEGQVMVSTPTTSSGALVRGLREADLKQLKAVSNNIRFGTLDGFDQQAGHRHRHAARQRAQREGRRPGLAAHAARRLDRARHRAAREALSHRRDLRDRHVGIRREHRLHAAQRGAALFQPARQRHRARSGARLARRGGRARAQDRHRRRLEHLCQRLAAAQRDLLHRAPGRAQRDVPDPRR